MDKTCGICRGAHFTADCPNAQHISRGDARTVTDTSILTRKVEDKPPPRRPSPFEPKTRGLVPRLIATQTSPQPVTAPRENTHATVTECPRCVTLSRDIVTLERDATLMRNKIASLETELRCELNKTRSKPPPLTPAERQRRARERKAARVRPAPKSPTPQR